MKATLSVLAAVAAVTSFGELRKLTEEELKIVNGDYAKLTEEQRERRPELMKLYRMSEFGGDIILPGTPKGTIRFVNLQTRVAAADLERVVGSFASMSPYDIALVGKDCAADIKITLVDKVGEPSLAVYPDEGRAVVNVAKLATDNPKPAFLAARTRKEALRAFAFLTAGSTYGASLYSYMKTPAALDDVAYENFPVDVIMRSKKYLKEMGVVAREQISYRDALIHGFDVAPTNEYQKAIYDDIKSHPEKIRRPSANAKKPTQRKSNSAIRRAAREAEKAKEAK